MEQKIFYLLHIIDDKMIVHLLFLKKTILTNQRNEKFTLFFIGSCTIFLWLCS